MPDRPAPSAARVATLTAVPIAIIAGLIAYASLGGFSRSDVSASRPASPGATDPVSLPAPSLGERAAVVCRALVSQLPQQIRHLPRRLVTAGNEQNAAYGDPAITVACGAAPPSFPPTATVYPLAGVCWYADDGQPGVTVWTTVDREVPVRVTVPRAYAAPGQWVAEFGPAVASRVPSANTVPAGCGA